MSIDLRRNVRASLSAPVIIQGTDHLGRPFQFQGESIDFSRKGLGLLVPRDIVGRGSVLTVTVPKRFHGKAVVQWTRLDADTGGIRIGCCLMNPKASLSFRIAASSLLCVAFVGQVSFGRSRDAEANSSCTMSLGRMKNLMESRLGEWTLVSDSEKAFIHLQHQQMSCEEYTRWYEKAKIHTDESKRAALSRWHWNQYHSKDETIRTAAVSGLELAVATGNE
jgi:hypothetical protein